VNLNFLAKYVEIHKSRWSKMDDLAGKEGVPPTMLNGREYATLVEDRRKHPEDHVDDVITSDACQALVDIFVALVNASPYREYVPASLPRGLPLNTLYSMVIDGGRPLCRPDEQDYDRESIMANPGDRPHIQCRLAHPFYRFERVGDGPRKNVPSHGYTRKVRWEGMAMCGRRASGGFGSSPCKGII
jgi:hypothetical protein